jgi:hypothetical protein
VARRFAESLTVAAPAVVLAVVGALAGERCLAEPGPGSPLRARVDELMISVGHAAQWWAWTGAAVAAWMMAVSLFFAFRARRHTTRRDGGPRRWVATVTGLLGVAAYVAWLLGTHDFGVEVRYVRVAIIAVPAVVGVVAIHLGAAGTRDEVAREQVSSDLWCCSVAAVLAVVVGAVAAALYTIVNLDPLGWIETGSPITIRAFLDVPAQLSTRWTFDYSLCFAAPVVAAAMVTPGDGERRASATVVALAVGCVASVAMLLQRERAAMALPATLSEAVASGVTALPGVPLADPDACDELVESDLVVVGPDDIRIGGAPRGSPPATDEACDVLARDLAGRARAQLHGDGSGMTLARVLPREHVAWISVRGDADAARVQCLVDALARVAMELPEPAERAASPRVYGGPTGSQGEMADPDAHRRHWPGKPVMRWVGRDESGGLVCLELPLVDPSDTECDSCGMPERLAELRIARGKNLALTWREKGRTMSSRSWVMTASPSTSCQVRQLADDIQFEWKAHGAHFDPADRMFDLAVVRADPGVPFDEVLAVSRCVVVPTRPVLHTGNGKGELPEFAVWMMPRSGGVDDADADAGAGASETPGQPGDH